MTWYKTAIVYVVINVNLCIVLLKGLGIVDFLDHYEWFANLATLHLIFEYEFVIFLVSAIFIFWLYKGAGMLGVVHKIVRK